jgi:hypothetical protein
MPKAAKTRPVPASGPVKLRRPNVDFDAMGRATPLPELLRMGGFFPLPAIMDRLPFSPKTIRQWASLNPGTPFLIQIRSHRGRHILTLINLDGLCTYLGASLGGRGTGPGGWP